MQFYSLVAIAPNGQERTCAMVQSADPDEARKRTEELIQAGRLFFVERNVHFKTRRSSRRETELLQRFLASCHRTDTREHLAGDLDSLLNRRNSLILSFFTAMYLAPDRLRDRLAGNPPSPSPERKTGSGTGGVEVGAPEAEADSRLQPEADASATGFESPVQRETPIGEEGAVDNSNQDAALAGILQSSEANDGGASRDGPVDLGDDDLY